MSSIEKNYKDLPIFKKAEEIYEIIKGISELVPEDNDYLQMVSAQMLGDAMMIQAKIAGAEGGDLYDIRMENAVFIRKAAHDLMVVKHSFAHENFEHVDYFEMVRDRIEEFRLLFIDWVESFDKFNYVIDRWGLFNPPGVGPHNHDPDDDIPWDGPEFEDGNF